MIRMRAAVACAALLSLGDLSVAFAQTESGAAELWPAIEPAPDRAVEYQTPQDPYYLRLITYELVVLGAGVGYYFWNKEVNSIDWEYDYTWSTFEDKLVGRAYSIDNNFFDTNYVSHPMAGAFYYWGARGNRLGPLASLGVAFASSALWELIGEYRERVSLNDTVVTPFGGAAFAEATFQLGAFFDRGCDTTTNRWLGALFGPAKSAFDAIDGARPRRPLTCDSHGFSPIGARRLEASLGAAAILPVDSELPALAVAELQARAELTNLRSWGAPGRGWVSFSDGNLALLELELAHASSAFTDVRLLARTSFAGLHYRDLRRVPWRGVTGREFSFGVGLGFDYARHRYEGLQSRFEPFSIVEVPSLASRWRWLDGPRKLDVQLVLASTFGGAAAFALQEYELDHDRSELTTVARNHGYHHGVGIALEPRVVWTTPGLELGLSARADRLFVITALDADGQHQSPLDAEESRRRVNGWVRIGPDLGPRLRLNASMQQRRGSIDTTTHDRKELRLGGAVELGF